MKILIVKIAAIGDVVMTLPLLTHIRSRHPKCHITWVCGSKVKPLLEATKMIDQLHVVDEQTLLGGSFRYKILALFKIWRLLLGKKFDLCLTAHPDPRYQWISFPIRCKDRRSLNRIQGRVNPVPGRYHSVEYMRLFTNEEGPDEVPIVFPKIPTSPSKKLSKPMVAIAPGGAKNVLADDALRRWPIASYASLMRSLAGENVQLVLTGNETDHWVKEHLKDIPVIDLIGKLNLLELVALLRECQLLITHDSGPLHLAKLADCPSVAIFGPTNPFEKVGPGEKIKVLWGGEHLACRPCYDGKTYAPCKKNSCMLSVTPDLVLKEALQLLGKSNDVTTISLFGKN